MLYTFFFSFMAVCRHCSRHKALLLDAAPVKHEALQTNDKHMFIKQALICVRGAASTWFESLSPFFFSV